MRTEFKPIEGRSTAYVAALGVLTLMVIGGVYSTYTMATQGLYLSGLSQRVPWGLAIVMAIFYIGLSAGSLVVSSLYGIFGRVEYRPFARLAAFSAVLFLAAALLSIITDQGRIDRVLTQPFLHLNPKSMFSINPALYFGYIAICLLYLFALFKEKKAMTKSVAVVGVAWAVMTHTGTGFIFATAPRELYTSAMLPVCFVTAALSSGCACMILIIVALFNVTKRPLDTGIVTGLGRLLAAFVLLTLFLVIIENIHRYYLFESRDAARFFLFGGAHSLLFFIGVVFIGSILPLMILFSKREGAPHRIVCASILVIIGIFCERWLIVIPGLIRPTELFVGMQVNVASDVAAYSPTGYEIVQVFGIFGVVGIGFLLGLRLLKLMPAIDISH